MKLVSPNSDAIVKCYSDLIGRDLVSQYKNVRLSEIKTFHWGRECFLHDPSGVLRNFVNFINNPPLIQKING